MDPRLIDDERALRFALWGSLQANRGPDDVAPSVLKELGVYGGARGIWVDKVRTRDLTDDGQGVTVALLHTGVFYDDDLSDDGVIYHYPRTETRGWDDAQIAATKNAAVLGIPVFVITRSSSSSARRTVRLGWVEEWDDNAGQFLVVFGEEPQKSLAPSDEEAPFSATQSSDRRRRLAAQRLGQARFRFHVLHRYGPRCAMCDIRVLQVLDTPHLVPVSESGTNDPRNGLVMCATHHRAFDSHLFGIEPRSLRVHFTSHGPDARALRVEVGNLAGLSTRPHVDALTWRWDLWRDRAGD